MRKLFTPKYLLPILFFLMQTLNGFAQALTEDFSYTTGTAITTNGYTAISAGGTNPIIVTSPPGLIFSGSPSSGVGNAIAMITSGEDDTKIFAPTINSGDAYTSFLINVTTAQTAGDYFFSLYDGGYKARVFIKSSGTGFVFGVAKNSTTASYEATVRTFNTTYLVVLKYTYNIGSATDDVVSLFVNPVLGLTEPSATIPATTSAGSGDAVTMDRIALRQGTAGSASAQTIDAIRVGTTWASVTPVATPTTTSISPTSANAGDPGFTLTVNGTNFVNGNSIVTWNGANRTTTFVSASQLTAIIPATDITTAGNATVGVTSTNAPALSNTQLFAINASSGATLTLTVTLAGFGNVCINTTSGANSFTLDGNNLDGTPITLAALSGFSYSEAAGGPYTTTSFTYSGNSFAGKIIYVKFSPTAVQSYNGSILLSGGGLASNYPVAATGSGVNDAPTVSTGVSSSVTATSAIAAGTINAPGCAAITAYGIEYSPNSGFPDGSGTQVPSTNLSAGNFTSGITALAPNTRYYYKAYATNSIGTAYGTQQFFTNTPLPVPMAIQPGLSYTENFADIANWSNFFITGTGANHFGGLSAIGSGGIPNGTTLTASTSSFQGAIFGSSGGVQKGTNQAPSTQSIVLLSTGSTDNTSSAAIDFYMDFTGLNAGTLSFDWASVNNATGDRNGSMRVYSSIDGITFAELAFASVLNFTNNSPTNGTKANIALPVSFNNSPTARLRFYYHNGVGGITPTGSRPKISIDNLNVTAVATTPCTSPTATATALNFGTITDVSIAGSFTAASPASDGYVVVISVNSSLTSNPVNGQIYNIGDNIGDGTVISNGSTTTFTATGLTPLTTYYFFVFPVNSVCTGGPLYFGTSLDGNATTVAGLPPCVAPALQPTLLILNPPAPSINTIVGSFTATAANEYLVLRSLSNSLTISPVNAQVYNADEILGNAVVVKRSSTTTFTANGLLPATQYYFFIFSLNSQACVNGPVYNIVSPLTGNETTQPLPPCVTPLAQPNTLILTASNTAVAGTFTGVPSADDYLVVRSLSPTLSATPVDNTDYNVGDNFGGGIIIANNIATSFLSTSLNINTTYYFYVFAANKNCSGGTKYAIGGPLTGNIVTTNVIANNYYFGTLHSHSDYSDGNTDQPGYTPAQDYDYAMTAQCMDYLGISEHNHFSAEALLANYHLGINQANAFTIAHPNFLALYGMEWGTIGTGGHVLIYGNGMDDLWGWESGSGLWGANNNYDVYVPKGVYTGNTGLFKNTNDNIATNTFASLAHPGLGDFNNLDAIPYDAVADNAITAVAVESGPSTSANITYSNPAFSMGYLWYYQTLLAKGYHLGPTIDHDNHKTTFGKTTYSRTAIVSPSLSKTAIVSALRNMNFYATQDCDSKVDFTINTKILGSIFTDRFAPNISVTLTDATPPPAGSAIIRVMFGIPGSGILPIKIDSVIGTALNFTDNNLTNLATGYYYIDITFGTGRIVTSPIWYTRNDAGGGPLPVSLNSFVVQKIDNSAKISWATEQETNSSHFVIERSVDGRTWNKIATIAAAGNSSQRIDYNIYDNAPMRGINYYRLKQVDKDARYDYSAIEKALFNSNYTAEIAPNPSKDFINLYMSKVGNNNQQAIVQLLNTAGKIIYKTTTTQSHLQINTTSFSKGLYFVKVIDAGNVTTIRVLVQ